MVVEIKADRHCDCQFCKNNNGFTLPNEIIEAAKSRQLVVFAGAGVSTESKKVYTKSLYTEICLELGINSNAGLSFSELMSIFCNQNNGRSKLLRKIKDRIDYVYSFPELYSRAADFHRELSTIEQVRDIVTTNWDDLFERECGATPFINAEDFIFWESADRRVLKIHGSINNYGSIVATEEDYKKCYKSLSTGLIGSHLKMILATKLVVFCGYSFGDEDFTKIYNSLIKEMKGLMPHSYIVTIDSDAVDKFKNLNMTPIVTDATFFIESLKSHLVGEGVLIDDSRFIGAYDKLDELNNVHRVFSSLIKPRKEPEAIYNLCYQDGLKHAFERMIALRKNGHYSHECNVTQMIQNYNQRRKEKKSKKIYHDEAYIDGYLNGLIFFLADDEHREHMPLYYIYGYKGSIYNIQEYMELIEDSNNLHKQALRYAESIVSRSSDDEIVFHHTPFL